jgi:hypothetical protein
MPVFRRRRPEREIAFSFDSFLDVVANVVGIILRLILVAWVGARSYKAVVPDLPGAVTTVQGELAALPDPTDPRLARIERLRSEVARQGEERLYDQEEQRRQTIEREKTIEQELTALERQRQALRAEQAETVKQVSRGKTVVQAVQMSLGELEKRSKVLLEELDRLHKLPRATKKLRYQTPVSAPLQTEELMFECFHGRVTLLDSGALIADIQRQLRSKSELLRTQWEVRDVTAPVGAFRLRYVIERERSSMDGPIARSGPMSSTYRYGVSAWEAEPVTSQRGETPEEALKAGSAFRKVIDSLDPQQTAVTFWVYPDSFAAYRTLRDYLHGRDIVVAGRPLPEGVPIASSRKGTVSRGQ